MAWGFFWATFVHEKKYIKQVIHHKPMLYTHIMYTVHMNMYVQVDGKTSFMKQ